MIGCCVAWKCLVACLFGESSQQPTCPHVRQMRKCTHGLPVFRHSSQPRALGCTFLMVSRWEHLLVTVRSSPGDAGTRPFYFRAACFGGRTTACFRGRAVARLPRVRKERSTCLIK